MTITPVMRREVVGKQYYGISKLARGMGSGVGKKHDSIMLSL
jgi:hypothetical protein